MSAAPIRPPTAAASAACDAIDRVVEAFIFARSQLPPSPYEADVEAITLFNLVIRHVEGVIALARTDLVLVPPAYASARAAFETAIKAAWMVDASDPFERETRWLVHLQEEERAHQRIAERSTDATLAARSTQHAKSIREFREGVTQKLPAHVKLLKGNPNLADMSKSIGRENLYLLYIYLSQFAHGGHLATSLYRQHLGTLKKPGEFIAPTAWHLAFRLCWLSLHHPGNTVLSRVSQSRVNFLGPDDEKAVLAAIDATAHATLEELH
jgi:hypothetical protein